MQKHDFYINEYIKVLSSRLNKHFVIEKAWFEKYDFYYNVFRRLLKKHNLTTSSTKLRFLWDFDILKLKICLLYHETLLLQKFNDTFTPWFLISYTKLYDQRYNCESMILHKKNMLRLYIQPSYIIVLKVILFSQRWN